MTPGSYRTYVSVGDSISIDRYPGVDVQEREGLPYAPDGLGAASLFHRNADECWPAFAGRDLATAFPGIRHLDLTVDGAMTWSMLEFQLPRIPRALEGPSLVTVTAGGNDLVGLLDAGFDWPAPGVPAEEGAADPVEQIAGRLMGMRGDFILTSESVTEGHPDKVCDAIADAMLDAYLEYDRAVLGGAASGTAAAAPGVSASRPDPPPHSRMGLEVVAKDGVVILAGEIASAAHEVSDGGGPAITAAHREEIVRRVVRDVGYVDPADPFCADRLEVLQFISGQASEIAGAVGDGGPSGAAGLGAGDQGMMFGYATDETPELMPLPILLAHRLTRGLAEDRKRGRVDWLRPDGKAQVTVRYRKSRPEAVTRMLVSTQHAADADLETVRAYVRDELVPRALGEWHRSDLEVTVNPGGTFVQGGPSADCGVTGRKIIVDTYGGAARHGGGAFSGKDPTKVDRSAAYYCRHVARQVVKEGLARGAEVAVAYAFGEPEPFSLGVETCGTGDAAEAFIRDPDRFDFRPAAMIEALGLREPIYRRTTNYGHFGRPGLPWEG